MSCTKSSINDDTPVNDLIRRAVRAEIESGANWMGATAALADFVGASPRMIRARCREELIGQSRMKRDLVEGCWAFMEMVARRRLVSAARLVEEVERYRPDRAQLVLPLEGGAVAAGSLPKPVTSMESSAIQSLSAANEPDANRAARIA